MGIIDDVAESRIREAIDRGDLDDLPGAGQPLDLDEDDAFVPPELRMAYKILRNAGFVPPEVETRREIHELEHSLRSETDSLRRDTTARRLQCLFMRLDRGRERQMNLQLQQEYYDRILRRMSRGSG